MVFNLVVTCVGSKNFSGPTIRDCTVNCLNRGVKNSVTTLFKDWRNTVVDFMRTNTIVPAQKMYKGGMWNASIEALQEIQGPSKLRILSAGFGFINANTNICGYKTTFKLGATDSIYNKNYFSQLSKVQVNRRWWDLLTTQGVIDTRDNPSSLAELYRRSGKGDIILIASGSDYYESIYNDLNNIGIMSNGPHLALVGIKKTNRGYEPDIPRHLWQFIQPYSNARNLQNFLNERYRCNSIQVHSKSAKHLITQYNATGNLHFQFP